MFTSRHLQNIKYFWFINSILSSLWHASYFYFLPNKILIYFLLYPFFIWFLFLISTTYLSMHAVYGWKKTASEIIDILKYSGSRNENFKLQHRTLGGYIFMNVLPPLKASPLYFYSFHCYVKSGNTDIIWGGNSNCFSTYYIIPFNATARSACIP